MSVHTDPRLAVSGVAPASGSVGLEGTGGELWTSGLDAGHAPPNRGDPEPAQWLREAAGHEVGTGMPSMARAQWGSSDTPPEASVP